MLRWYREQYSRGREAVNIDQILPKISETLKAQGIKTSESLLKKMMLIILVELAEHFDKNVEDLIQINDDMVLFKDTDLDNMLVFQKTSQVAFSDIKRTFYNKTLPTVEMQGIMKDYISNSIDDISKGEERIKQLEKQVSQKEKEKNDGI